MELSLSQIGDLPLIAVDILALQAVLQRTARKRASAHGKEKGVDGVHKERNVPGSLAHDAAYIVGTEDGSRKLHAAPAPGPGPPTPFFDR